MIYFLFRILAHGSYAAEHAFSHDLEAGDLARSVRDMVFPVGPPSGAWIGAVLQAAQGFSETLGSHENLAHGEFACLSDGSDDPSAGSDGAKTYVLDLMGFQVRQRRCARWCVVGAHGEFACNS